MPQPHGIVDGDVIVREFEGRYLIWRFHDEQERWFFSSHEGLGECDDRDDALLRAAGAAGRGHAVWFCDTRERYERISSWNQAEIDNGAKGTVS